MENLDGKFDHWDVPLFYKPWVFNSSPSLFLLLSTHPWSCVMVCVYASILIYMWDFLRAYSLQNFRPNSVGCICLNITKLGISSAQMLTWMKWLLLRDEWMTAVNVSQCSASPMHTLMLMNVAFLCIASFISDLQLESKTVQACDFPQG